MPAKKKSRKPMSEEARAAASERMRKFNEAKKAQPPLIKPELVPVPHEHQWLPGDYKAHDGSGWRLVQVYCPVGDHWEGVDA